MTQTKLSKLKLTFVHGDLINFPSLSSPKGTETKLMKRKQNRIWSAEHSDFALLLCGFEWERFEITRNVIELILPNQMSSHERTWLTQMNAFG
ncbi:MAG: hypothetical protein ACTS5A_01370 [Candidatus Hodgkinia cicadicola]